MAFLGSIRSGLAAVVLRPAPMAVATREMATLKEVKNRIRSVKNIQKITKSMKMVAAAKLRGVQSSMELSRPLYNGVAELFQAPKDDKSDADAKKQTVVALTSDRGLCGSVNSSVAKAVRASVRAAKQTNASSELVVVGDKGRAALSRDLTSHFVLTINEVGKRKPVSFAEASVIASTLLDKDFDKIDLVFNRFRSVIAFETSTRVIPSFARFLEQTQGSLDNFEFDGERDDILRNLYEYYLGVTIYNSLLESATCEMSQKMSAMDNASRNAGDMINRLTLLYNRSRQASITRELIEIISGANALES
eukprot:TRINITY_DN936_c0_g1_i1.p1 TRINITY_DN936_c0_g1~~TRINITY_DN936_c0_g1_i1.p1  ORF type:complete len:307 (+),score=78.43 TRINITY_DN936_c0_g1_i1:51-971(+)